MKLSDYRKISAAVEADIAKALEKYGLKPQPFGARIDERLGEVHIKLHLRDVNHKDAAGNATTPEAEIYKTSCGVYDLKPEYLGQSFHYGSFDYKLVGMKRRGDKCILVERADNKKTYLLTPEQVAGIFALKERRGVEAPGRTTMGGVLAASPK